MIDKRPIAKDQITLEEVLKLVSFTRSPDGDLLVLDVIADVRGEVQGKVFGDVYDGVGGDITADVWGNVEGDIRGYVRGDIGAKYRTNEEEE
jgi:hypothetical protein